jgi:hypothetical protein
VTLALRNDWLPASITRQRPSGVPPAGNLFALLAGCPRSPGRYSPLDKGTAPPTGHAGMLRRSNDSQATSHQFLGPWEARLVDKRRFRLAERTAAYSAEFQRALLLLNFSCCVAALLPWQPIGHSALGDAAALSYCTSYTARVGGGGRRESARA